MLFSVAGDLGDIEELKDLPHDWVSLNTDAIEKNLILKEVILRILELKRSPRTATIRHNLADPKNIARNAVDFVILERIFERCNYKHLRIGSVALHTGRRRVTVTNPGKPPRKAYIGYSLCEALAREGHGDIRDLEKLNYMNFFIGLLRDLADTLPEEYELPGSFIETPSVTVKTVVRKGPAIRTRKAERSNLYIPYSYVKSAECLRFPETSRRECTDLGAHVMVQADCVNKLSLREADNAIPKYQNFIYAHYLAGDKIRSEWRRNQFVPTAGGLIRFSNTLIDEKTQDILEVSQETVLLNVNRITCIPVSEDPIIRKEIKEEISSLMRDKAARRTRNRTV
jgi:hypothetical protein